MSEIDEELEKVVKNTHKSQVIRESHSQRKKLLLSIQKAEPVDAMKILDDINELLTKDSIDIMKRIEGNKLRSYKNFMLSHNSMYALVAENGGLDPVLAHYMSEKYAILIEHATSIQELEKMHLQFLEDYSSPKNRYLLETEKTLSSKVYNYILNNFMNPIEIQMIADELFVTKEHLMRRFKKETGKTINDVIKEKRLEEAEALLQSSRLSVTDIAIMVGFNSLHYFSNVFKKEKNISPTEFQKKYIKDR